MGLTSSNKQFAAPSPPPAPPPHSTLGFCAPTQCWPQTSSLVQVDQTCSRDFCFQTVAGGFSVERSGRPGPTGWGRRCAVRGVDSGKIVSCGVLLFRKHENLYVSDQGHLWCFVPGSSGDRPVVGEWVSAAAPAAGVHRGSFSSRVSRACLQKQPSFLLYELVPRAWRCDSATLHIVAVGDARDAVSGARLFPVVTR